MEDRNTVKERQLKNLKEDAIKMKQQIHHFKILFTAKYNALAVERDGIYAKVERECIYLDKLKHEKKENKAKNKKIMGSLKDLVNQKEDQWQQLLQIDQSNKKDEESSIKLLANLDSKKLL